MSRCRGENWNSVLPPGYGDFSLPHGIKTPDVGADISGQSEQLGREAQIVSGCGCGVALAIMAGVCFTADWLVKNPKLAEEMFRNLTR